MGVQQLAGRAGLEAITCETRGNAMVTIGYHLELAAEDFTAEELALRDPYHYVGVYSVLRKREADLIKPQAPLPEPLSPRITPVIKASRFAVLGVLSHSTRAKDGVTAFMRRQAVRDTWKRHAPADFVFVFVMDEHVPEIEAEVALFGDIHFLGTEEKGQAVNFGEKYLEFARWANREFNFEWLMIVDDDAFVCLEKVVGEMRELSKNGMRSVVWGWWFLPSMLYNPDLATHSRSNDTIGEICEQLAESQDIEKSKLDSLFMVVSNNLLRSFVAGDVVPKTMHLMDSTLAHWLLPLNKNFIVDNARIIRGNYTYGPDFLPERSNSFCQDRVVYHKCHPTVMGILERSAQAVSSQESSSRVHPSCVQVPPSRPP